MELQDKAKTTSNSLSPWITSMVLLPLMFYFVYNHGKFTFIDYVNLLIHEGGHGIFSIFGKFIYTLGGTIAQIIIPVMFVIYYWKIKKRNMTQIFLVWLGENLINISIYAADARAHKLPLLGGNRVYHDWTYILNQTNLIMYDYEVGIFFYSLGILAFLISFLLPIIMKEYKEINLNLNL